MKLAQLLHWIAIAWLVCAPGSVSALTLAHQFARDSLPDQAAHRFATRLSEESRGRFKVDVLGQARLGDERDNADQLRGGKIHFSVIGDLLVSELPSEFRVVNLPFLYRDTDHALRIYDERVGAGLQKAMSDLGVVPLSWHYTGTRMLTSNSPVSTREDLRKIVLRLPSDKIWHAGWRLMGAETKEVPFNQLAQALKLGMVTAQENPPNFLIVSKIYEGQKYLIETNHMPQRQFLVVSRRYIDSLDRRDRALLQRVAREVSGWVSQEARQQHVRAIGWLTTQGGMQLMDFKSPLTHDELRQLARDLAGQPGVRLVNEILKSQ